MRSGKAIILILLIIMTTSVMPLPSHAASPSNYEKAVDLKILGLLEESPRDFQLNRAPTRLEGAMIMVRLLGKGKPAANGHYKHPFTDVPDRAGSYVGYIYQNKLITGVSNSRFGSDDPLNASQYVTFLLRVLGYRDNVDFRSSDVMKKAVEKGLLTSNEASALNGSKKFLRDDMVGMTYNALFVKLRNSSQTLLDKLATADNAVFEPAARVLSLYAPDRQKGSGGLTTANNIRSGSSKAAKSEADLLQLIQNAIYGMEPDITIDISAYGPVASDELQEISNEALDAAEEASGVKNLMSSMRYQLSRQRLKLTFEYRYSKSEYERRRGYHTSAVNKARYTVAELITPDMSDYKKEKLLHDYIINNTVYDYRNYTKGTIPYESCSAYGCLVRGSAVCEGYTQAMKLLCDLAGIECIVVAGEMKDGVGSHGWNIVKIDGAWCHVDLTSDDPVSNDGTDILTYSHFNLNDSEMAKSFVWDRNAYPVCSTLKNSYYYRSNKLAKSRSDFDKAALAALKERESIIELKVMDYSGEKYSSLSDVMRKSGNVRSYRYTINDMYGVIRIFNIQYDQKA